MLGADTSSAPTTIVSSAATRRSSAARIYQANASFLSSHSRSTEREEKSGMGGGITTYSTRRFTVSGQAEHYDRGFRMDTAFVIESASRGLAISGAKLLSVAREISLDQAHQSLFWFTGADDRGQGGSEAFYLPAVRFNFTRAGNLRLDYEAVRDVRRTRFETGG